MKRSGLFFCVLILVFGLFGCSDDEDIVSISFSGLSANGVSGVTATTELTLSFDKDPVGLALEDITLTGATKGTLSGSGTTRKLTISAITVGNDGEVTVILANPTGFTITPASRSVPVYLAPTPVSFTDLTANGLSWNTATTELTLSFDKDPVGLTIDEIELTGATKGTLSGSGTTRKLTISNIKVGNGGSVGVVLASPTGYTITPASRSVPVYLAPNPVEFTGLSANGSSWDTATTELTLTFDLDPVGLTIDEIELTGATKGTLSGSGTTRKLTISAITVGNGGEVTVILANPTGFTITPASRSIPVYLALTPVSFSDLTANGSSWDTATTELTLSFDKDPTGLAIEDITLTGATKGTLSGGGMTRKLTISNIAVGNGGLVGVSLSSPTGYTITPTSRSVPAYITYREFVTVPGGTYEQKPTSGNTFTHTVSSFRLARFQVTYDLWHEVYTWAIDNGYYFANPGREGNNGGIGTGPSDRKFEPVTTANWRDAIVWCNAYSQMEGKTPVYYTDAGFTIPIRDSRDGSYGSSINTTAGSFDNPFVNWNATGYRLPTEGEWQYAASYINGSSWTPYNHASGATADYNDATATGAVAWYTANAGSTTHEVGGKAPNALGIYDMSGNVREWCWDWYGAWSTDAKTDYRGPGTGSYRSHRGGWFSYYADILRVGYRSSDGPYNEGDLGGFRLARPLE